MLDNGKAVGLEAVPNEMLKCQLGHILNLLGLKCTQSALASQADGPQLSLETLERTHYCKDLPADSAVQHSADGDASAELAAEEPLAAKRRRIVGPAAPNAELLAAAAAYHAEQEAAGGYFDSAAAVTDDLSEPLVGPPPPHMILEADAAPANARDAEVARVLQVLRSMDWEAAPAAGPQQPSAAPVPDPYAVLGVDQAADSASIRKSYWKLSLLVHPDKCSHPAAQEVFTAVSKAAQLLQDTEQRKQFDADAEDAQLRKAALAAAEAAEREVAWKRARGEAVPAELAAAVAAAKAAGAGPARRDDWMTQLPTQQQKTAASALAAGLSQKKKKDKDKEKGVAGKEKTAEKAKDSKAPAAGADEGWVGKHPWKPFDREKDLEVQFQRPKGTADLLKAAGALSSRFSGGNR
eukprot:gene13672-13794_t